MKKHKAKRPAKRVRVTRVRLPRTGVLRIEAPKQVIPVVVPSAPGKVEIVPVTVREHKKKKSWIDYLLGE